MALNPVYLCAFARTPVTKLSGALAPVAAPHLGATAIKAALTRASVAPELVEECIMGNVIAAGMGQAPARQAAKYAGLQDSTRCTTVNKVCASGMKSVMLAAQNIAMGHTSVAVAGGFESMTNVPHLLAARAGVRLGNAQLVDAVVYDGLWDPYDNQHMGMCAEACAAEYSISREEQDAYAVQSYARAQEAVNVHRDEITPVEVKGRRGAVTVVDADEEPLTGGTAEQMAKLKPAFMRDGGTVTAGNASKINDGAAAFVMMSEEAMRAHGVTPIAKIIGYADAEQEPVKFTTAPALAAPIAMERAGVTAADVGAHEINEAFSVVALANMRLLDLDPAIVNVHGGAVGMGHPIGMSGARIMGSLVNVLTSLDKSVGVASICNGGGGASAIVVERV